MKVVILDFVEPLERGVISNVSKWFISEIKLEGLHGPLYMT